MATITAIRKKTFIRVVGFLVIASSASLFTWSVMYTRVYRGDKTLLKPVTEERLRRAKGRIHSYTATKKAIFVESSRMEDVYTKLLQPKSSVIQPSQLAQRKTTRSPFVQTAKHTDANAVKTGRQRLVIVGQARTGSSFLGDAFNQHPDVFYLFEPLYGVAPPKVVNDLRPMRFLEGMLRCQFDFPQYVREIEKFRRFSSKALSSRPMCGIKNSSKTRKLECVRLTPRNMKSSCMNYSATVLKILTARIPNYRVDSLFPLCNSSDCGMIYLVRDPRPLIFSHMKVGFAWEKPKTRTTDTSPQPIVRQYSQKICQQIEQNVRIFQNLPSWSKGRFLLLRYETLARDPVEILRKLYRMAGLEMLPSTLKWIEEHTGEGKSSSRDESNHYSTKRDSKTVVDRWRIEMDPCIVNIIEESCRSVMKLLGYSPVDWSDKVV